MSKPKSYLVVLDPKSVIGAMYLSGNNDGTSEHLGTRYAHLRCTAIDWSNPFGPKLSRTFRRDDGNEGTQHVLIPHHAIVAVYDAGGVSDDPPFGFFPR